MQTRLMFLFLLATVSKISCAQINNKEIENYEDAASITSVEYKKEDSELNNTYRLLMSKLTTKEKDRLRLAQLAWIKFRDLQCDFEINSFDSEKIQQLVKKACLTTITKQRAAELLQFSKDFNK